MRTFLFCFATLAFAVSADAAGVVKLSTSGSDADAGSILNLREGESGSMFVWISTDPGQVLSGVSVLFGTDNPENWMPTVRTIVDNGRWVSADNAQPNLLLAQAFALPPFAGTGLTTAGPSQFALFSQLSFDARQVGLANLSLQAGPNGFGQVGVNGSVANQFGFSGGTLNVTAVPEPSALALMVVVGVGFVSHRYIRRRRVSLAA